VWSFLSHVFFPSKALVNDLFRGSGGRYSRSQCEEALLLSSGDSASAAQSLEEEHQRRQQEQSRVEEESEVSEIGVEL
jgi:hypothetical protein